MYYFDNAATTAQKPDCVAKAVYQVLSSGTVGNPSRGAHGYASRLWPRLAGQGRREGLVSLRAGIRRRFHAQLDGGFEHGPQRTHPPGDGVLTTSWEHNAVLRPLYQLEKEGVSLAFIGSDQPAGPCSTIRWKPC